MNRENDILNRTRFLIQDIKNYTDNRIDEAVEDAVRRAFEERRRERNAIVAIITILIAFMFGVICVCFVLKVIMTAPDCTTFEKIAGWIVSGTWFFFVFRFIDKQITQRLPEE